VRYEQISTSLFVFSSLIALAALVKSTLERRAPGHFPILDLIRERFIRPRSAARSISLAILAGTAVVWLPLLLFLGAGWVQVAWPTGFSAFGLLLGILTIMLKFIWAAIEELIYRGAVMPQAARLIGGVEGLIFSALLFALGHFERRGAALPNGDSLVVLFLDGLGFGVAFLATRSLWIPTFWHASKNIWIWLLFGESTLQFTSGPFHIQYSGPVLWVGMPGQAGFIDVLVTLIITSLAFWICRNELCSGLRWVEQQ